MELKARRRAVVCGASKGIGKAVAIELANAGVEVILLARSEEKLKAIVDDLDISAGQDHKYIVVDMASPDKVRAGLKNYISESSPIHILINNTGGPDPGQLLDAELDQLARAFTMHILTSQVLTQLLVPGMKEAGYGRIVNIISTSVKEPINGLGVSNTIRGAMASWAKSMSNELAGQKITVNNVLPGYTDTERLSQLIDLKAVTAGVPVETMRQKMNREVPASRFAEASEIASVVKFLCSEQASYITGVNLPVDGGRTKSL